MANPYINIYKDNPTAGAKDGTVVSTGGAYTAPISFLLNAAKNDNQTIKVAIRTENGYTTMYDTEIYTQYTTDALTTVRQFNNLKLSWNANSSFGAKIQVSSRIGNTNKIFYVQASANESENIKVDKSIRLVVKCTIVPAS